MKIHLELCHAMGTRKKRRRKSCHSIYEWEELASYIPIAKPSCAIILLLPAACSSELAGPVPSDRMLSVKVLPGSVPL